MCPLYGIDNCIFLETLTTNKINQEKKIKQNKKQKEEIHKQIDHITIHISYILLTTPIPEYIDFIP